MTFYLLSCYWTVTNVDQRILKCTLYTLTHFDCYINTKTIWTRTNWKWVCVFIDCARDLIFLTNALWRTPMWDKQQIINTIVWWLVAIGYWLRCVGMRKHWKIVTRQQKNNNNKRNMFTNFFYTNKIRSFYRPKAQKKNQFNICIDFLHFKELTDLLCFVSGGTEVDFAWTTQLGNKKLTCILLWIISQIYHYYGQVCRGNNIYIRVREYLLSILLGTHIIQEKHPSTFIASSHFNVERISIYKTLIIYYLF